MSSIHAKVKKKKAKLKKKKIKAIKKVKKAKLVGKHFSAKHLKRLLATEA